MEQPRTLSIHNGEKLTSVFSEDEMGQRLKKLRSCLNNEGINAALFTSFHNINYFDHYLYTAFGRNYGFVITPERTCSITANIDGGHPWRRGIGNNIVYTIGTGIIILMR